MTCALTRNVLDVLKSWSYVYADLISTVVVQTCWDWADRESWDSWNFKTAILTGLRGPNASLVVLLWLCLDDVLTDFFQHKEVGVLSCFAAMALMCYECFSTKNPDCGRYFRPYSIKSTACKAEETICALQRQDEIPGGEPIDCVYIWSAFGCISNFNGSVSACTLQKKAVLNGIYICMPDVTNCRPELPVIL